MDEIVATFNGSPILPTEAPGTDRVPDRDHCGGHAARQMTGCLNCPNVANCQGRHGDGRETDET